MVKTLLENNITLKVAGLSTSSGLVSVWVFDMTEKTLGLGVLGFIISIFSFIHDYSNSSEKKNAWQIISDVFKYMAFGSVAFPSAYAFLSNYFKEEPLLVAGGVFASYFIVYFLDVIVRALVRVIENWRVK